MNIYYVYEHWRTDKDECFYVGKGKGKRAYNVNNRNPHHKAIMAKLSREGFAMEVKIVASGLTEEEAFNLEIDRIAFWRSSGADLVNMTSGGDGVSGYEFTESHIKKLSSAKIGKKLSDETKKKMSESRKGRIVSKETIEKIKKSNLGKKRSAEQNAENSARVKKLMQNPELRKKLSDANKGKSPSKEVREKISLSLKGRKLTDEHKAKIGFANKDKKYALGTKRSDETRFKMSISAKIREAKKRGELV